MKQELEVKMADTSARCVSLEAEGAAATARLSELEAELARRQEEAGGRAAELSSQIKQLEGELAAAGSERAALEARLAAAGAEAEQLSSDVAAKAAALAGLQEQMAAAQAESAAKVRGGGRRLCWAYGTSSTAYAGLPCPVHGSIPSSSSDPDGHPWLPFRSALQVKEADEALVRLAEERNAIVSEKDAAVRQAVELQNQVGGEAGGREALALVPSWVGSRECTKAGRRGPAQAGPSVPFHAPYRWRRCGRRRRRPAAWARPTVSGAPLLGWGRGASMQGGCARPLPASLLISPASPLCKPRCSSNPLQARPPRR